MKKKYQKRITKNVKSLPPFPLSPTGHLVLIMILVIFYILVSLWATLHESSLKSVLTLFLESSLAAFPVNWWGINMRIAIDFRTGIKITRPTKHALFIFDFDFRRSKSGSWIYLNSSNQLSDFGHQVLTTLKHGGQYRIIEVSSGKIVQANTKTMRRSSCQPSPKP